jgi:hypothetical protein
MIFDHCDGCDRGIRHGDKVFLVTHELTLATVLCTVCALPVVMYLGELGILTYQILGPQAVSKKPKVTTTPA